MAQAANGNVVALGDHPRAKARPSPQETASLLTGCRDLALERMVAALKGMLDRVEDELFELAGKTTDRDAQAVYLDARSQAREKRALIESAFRQHFVEFFNGKVRGDRAAAKPAPAPGELSLMGDEDLEENLAVSEMSRKLKAACEGELGPLAQRMGFLLERATLEDDANPIGAELVCDALKRAIDQVQSGFKVRMALLRQVERHAEAEMQRVYHELNVHLVDRRVLPEVQLTRRPAQPRREETRPAAAPPAKEPATPNDLFGSLAQLLGASLGGAGAAAAGPATWPLAGNGTMPPPAPALMEQLTKMHRELPPSLPAVAGGAPDALVNLVRNVKATASSLGAVDAMTIDIVAMLFDYIFDDRHIPASVKALIGRLQIPTLKVALMDKSFFSSKAHPARRLIDLLAEASMGLDASSAAGRAALEMVERAVAQVLENFEADIAPFEAAIADVGRFLDDQKRAEEQIVERSARLIEARERQELARMVAEEEISRRLALRQWVPAAVRALLERQWMLALADVHAVEGEGSNTWQGFMLTMDDLLWSVEPKCTPEDRKRLVTMLPAMLRHLHDGLNRAKASPEQCDTFFGALVDCHAAAVKAGLRGMAIVPEAPAPPPPVEPVSIESEVIPAGDIQVEEIRLKTSRGSQVRNVFTRTGIWTNLQRGTWVEFTRPTHEPTRARLTWISPNKGVYLFTNPMSEASALSVSPEALAEQMRLGHARVLDDAALVDRAVDSMLATLKRA